MATISKAPTWNRGLILLVAAAIVLNYVDRGTVGVAAPLLKSDLGLTARTRRPPLRAQASRPANSPPQERFRWELGSAQAALPLESGSDAAQGESLRRSIGHSQWSHSAMSSPPRLAMELRDGRCLPRKQRIGMKKTSSGMCEDRGLRRMP